MTQDCLIWRKNNEQNSLLKNDSNTPPVSTVGHLRTKSKATSKDAQGQLGYSAYAPTLDGTFPLPASKPAFYKTPLTMLPGHRYPNLPRIAPEHYLVITADVPYVQVGPPSLPNQPPIENALVEWIKGPSQKYLEANEVKYFSLLPWPPPPLSEVKFRPTFRFILWW